MKKVATVAAGGLLIVLAVAAVPPSLPDPSSAATQAVDYSASGGSQTAPATVTTAGIRVSLPTIALSQELLERLEEIREQVLREQERLASSHPVTPGLEDGNVLSRGPRITYKEVTEVVEIPFGTTERDDPESLAGTRSVVSAGVAGVKDVTWTVAYSDGVETDRQILSETVVREPIDEIVAVGTKAPPPPPPAVPAGEAQQIAQSLLAERGWGDSEFSCLVALWQRESGWRTTAGRLDGPYGIPQANPGTKMASAGPDWQTNATTQIVWGLGYISGRYGTPCGAWEHFQTVGWY